MEYETPQGKTTRLNSDYNQPNLLKLLAGPQFLSQPEMCHPEVGEGRTFTGENLKSYFILPRLDGQSDLKTVVEYLQKQVTEVRISSQSHHNAQTATVVCFWLEIKESGLLGTYVWEHESETKGQQVPNGCLAQNRISLAITSGNIQKQ